MNHDTMTDGEFRAWKRRQRTRLPYLKMRDLQREGKTFTEIAEAVGAPREQVINELYYGTILER